MHAIFKLWINESFGDTFHYTALKADHRSSTWNSSQKISTFKYELYISFSLNTFSKHVTLTTSEKMTN